MLGFDALGRLALGQVPGGANNVVLVADAGSFSLTGVGAAFAVSLAPVVGSYAVSGAAGSLNTSLLSTVGSFALTGVSASFKVSESAAAGSYTLSGVAAPFKVSFADSAGSYALTGKAAPFAVSLASVAGSFVVTGYPVNDLTTEVAAPSAFLILPTDTPLLRTGGDYEFPLGGIGHYLVAQEEARQLQRITRVTPRPIDRTSAPTFRPVGGPPMLPIARAPILQGAPNQAAGAQMAAMQAAAIKRRRQEEEFLLIAS